MDLDGCLDPETGEAEPWAMQIVEDLSSYTEVSPSGTGLHVIARAELPEGRRRDDKIEMYDRGRFFTVTGRRLPGTPHLIEERQEQIAALHARLFPTREVSAPSMNGTLTPTNDLSDGEILQRAVNATNGKRFARLWAGDRSSYPSDSVVPVVPVDSTPEGDNGDYSDNGTHRGQEQPVHQTPAFTDATVATDARSEYQTRPADDTDARSRKAGNGRERFTI